MNSRSALMNDCSSYSMFWLKVRRGLTLIVLLPLFSISAFYYTPFVASRGIEAAFSLKDFQGVPEPIYQALLDVLQHELINDTLVPGSYGLLSWRAHEAWGLGNIGADYDLDGTYSLEESFIVAVKYDSGGWKAITQHNAEFEAFLSDSPETFLAREAIPLLVISLSDTRSPASPSLTTGIPLDLRFPWRDGQEWSLGILGIHDGALDFLPHPSIPVEVREVVAAYQGVIYARCSQVKSQDYLEAIS